MVTTPGSEMVTRLQAMHSVAQDLDGEDLPDDVVIEITNEPMAGEVQINGLSARGRKIYSFWIFTRNFYPPGYHLDTARDLASSYRIKHRNF